MGKLRDDHRDLELPLVQDPIPGEIIGVPARPETVRYPMDERDMEEQEMRQEFTSQVGVDVEGHFGVQRKSTMHKPRDLRRALIA